MRQIRLVGRRAFTAGCVLILLVLAVQPASIAAQDSSQQGGTSESSGGATFQVFAHREGLVGHTTANGHVIQPNDYFVALPCFCALSSKGGHEFQVRVEYEGNSLVLPVWDVGPWNTDDNYWAPQSERNWTGLPQGVPAAEAAYEQGYNGGLDGAGRAVGSPAGIDIADGAFAELGMTHSDHVTVTFLWQQEQPRVELGPLPAQYPNVPTVQPGKRPPIDHTRPLNSPNYSYIPETQHNVPKPILDYWYAHGGWQTQGLPISEFFRQVTEDGTARYVQYFERAILSMRWPEDGGPPVVSAEDLGHRVYIDPEANEPIEPFTPDDYATYFPETGHSLAGGFRDYWESYGGAEVFGKPLSEEWSTVTNDGRKVVLQVFERARLEWWPDRRGTDEEITLGHLTIDLLHQNGWFLP